MGKNTPFPKHAAELPKSTKLKRGLVPVLLYAVFFFWHTDLGGPYGDDEINEVVAAITAAGNNPGETAIEERFARGDSGAQCLIPNVLDQNANPLEHATARRPAHSSAPA
ncbi:MAG: hypothetical protein ACJA09_001227 [Alcanivorax sp.]|jgi:hypothetical protein